MKIFLPPARGREENFLILSVNGRRDMVMKGVETELSPALCELLRSHAAAELERDRFLERVSTP